MVDEYFNQLKERLKKKVPFEKSQIFLLKQDKDLMNYHENIRLPDDQKCLWNYSIGLPFDYEELINFGVKFSYFFFKLETIQKEMINQLKEKH